MAATDFPTLLEKNDALTKKLVDEAFEIFVELKNANQQIEELQRALQKEKTKHEKAEKAAEATNGEIAEEVEEKQARIKGLEQKNKQLNSEWEKTKAKLGDAEKYGKAQNDAYQTGRTQLKQANARLKTTEEEIQALQNLQKECNAQVKDLEDQVDRAVTEKMGNTELIGNQLENLRATVNNLQAKLAGLKDVKKQASNQWWWYGKVTPGLVDEPSELTRDAAIDGLSNQDEYPAQDLAAVALDNIEAYNNRVKNFKPLQ